MVVSYMSQASTINPALKPTEGLAAINPAADIHLPRGALLALSVSAFGSGISMRVSDPLLPGLAQEFSLTLGHAALVITVFAIAYGFSQLIFGPLGDRFGKYRVIAWGTLGCALTTAVCALAPTFELLLVARAMAGASAAAIIPLAMAWIGDVTPYERRQPILARFMIGQVLGVSAGVLLGGYAADHLHWRTPFEAIAVLFAVGGAYLLWINQRLPAAAKRTTPAQGSAIRRMVSEFGQVLSVPWARVVLLTVFAEGAAIFGSLAFMVTHLHRVHAIQLSMAGEVVMLFGLGGLLFAVSAYYLVHRLGEVGLCRWGGLLVAASYATVAEASNWWWAMPACFASGLGFYMLHNTLQINATQMAPERRGAAVAAFAASYFIGQSVGIAVSGFLIPAVGTSGVILLGALGVTAVSLNFAHLMCKYRSEV
jgi:predicted MFS family arabinose efflux permease